jgi:hypothetical protein
MSPTEVVTLTHPEVQGLTLIEVLQSALARGFVWASSAGGARWPLAEYAQHLDSRALRQKIFVSETETTLHASLMDDAGNVSHELPIISCTR